MQDPGSRGTCCVPRGCQVCHDAERILVPSVMDGSSCRVLVGGAWQNLVPGTLKMVNPVSLLGDVHRKAWRPSCLPCGLSMWYPVLRESLSIPDGVRGTARSRQGAIVGAKSGRGGRVVWLGPAIPPLPMRGLPRQAGFRGPGPVGVGFGAEISEPTLLTSDQQPLASESGAAISLSVSVNACLDT